jgi:hypothetical protein
MTSKPSNHPNGHSRAHGVMTRLVFSLLISTCGEPLPSGSTTSPPAITPNLPIDETELADELAKRKKLSQSEPLVFDDISSIIQESCTNGVCHGGNAPPSRIFVGNETNLLNANEKNPAARIRNNSMPRGGVLSPTDKSLLLEFLDQEQL